MYPFDVFETMSFSFNDGVTGNGKVKGQQNGDLMVINPLVMEY